MADGSPLHLLDVTLFYSPTSGGVRRYLEAKHAWIGRHRPREWQHTLLVPGDADLQRPGGCSTLAGLPIPGTFNYRLPLSPRRWRRAMEGLAPDIVEVGDAFHTAWTAHGVARRRGIPHVAFFHSNLPHIFDRFYRSTNAVKQTKGAGLGLYLARAIVESHGGRIWAEGTNGSNNKPKPDAGARICFSLPR